MISVLKERLKTFLLLSLVVLSLFLIRQFWIQSPYEAIVFEDEEEKYTDYLFADMIKPNKYLLNFNEKSHTIFYNDKDNNLWTGTYSSLATILSSDDIEAYDISNEEFLTYNDSKSIVFYFPEKFYTYILARSLNVTKPNDITEMISEVDSIYVYLGRGEPYIVFSQGDQHLKVHSADLNVDNIEAKLDEVEESKNYSYYYPMKDTLDVDNNIYIPYKMSKTMPLVYVKNELDSNNIHEVRNIAETFFDKDIDYVREIIENNGSILYLYDQKVLKINQNGLLEYLAPLEEDVHERNLYISLNTVSEFLSTHVGGPKDMYLAEIEEIQLGEDLGYRLTFKYRIRGFPVVLKSNVAKDFIQIEVFNKHIRNYKRFIREDMNIKDYDVMDSSKMLSAFDVINMNYDLLEKNYIEDNNIPIEDIDIEILTEVVLSSITDISVAYLDPCQKEEKEELIGVWLLNMEGRTYAFDVYEGNLVLDRKQ